jgi:hypothetical protein
MYYMCADLYRKRLGCGDAGAVDAALRTLKQVEVRLREFLTFSAGVCRSAN